MASTIPRKSVNVRRLQSPEEVQSLFTKRFNDAFGKWLYQGAFGQVRAAPQVAPTPPLLQTQPDSENGATSAGEDLVGDTTTECPDASSNDFSDSTNHWPLRYSLMGLSQESVLTNMANVTRWVQDWHHYEKTLTKGIHVEWLTRRWSKLGEQTLPVAVTVESPDALATWVGCGPRWKLACARRDSFTAKFEGTQQSTIWSRHFDVLADWADKDIERLQTLLDWFLMHPESGLYLRQLPVPGIDTKWIESRKSVVRDFVLAVNSLPLLMAAPDFHDVCGLHKSPFKMRIRILCPKLRASLAGLCDIEAPLEEIARMSLPIRAAIIVENHETGDALPDFDGVVAFMGLGHAISKLGQIPWLRPDSSQVGSPSVELPQLVYWGDMDTHGFAILARARSIFSRMQSVLMDLPSFMEGKELWVVEVVPHPAQDLLDLTPAERDVHTGLRENRWGQNLRLEQERLPWTLCVSTLHEVLG